MSRVEWEIRGPAFGNCNCNFGCPCQFNALPTHGDCRALTGMRIEQGHFSDVDLSGLKWILTYEWPKAVHEGNGTQQAFIEEGANEAQRDALCTILQGKEAVEGMSVFQVFSSTVTTFLDPQFVPMEIDIDVAARTARVHVPELVDSIGEPIRNETTGEAQEISVSLPGGFEFKQANYASGTTKTKTAIALDLQKSHGHFGVYHFDQNGIIG